MKELIENKLKKEYATIGDISITQLHQDTAPTKLIRYVNAIFENAKPLDIDEPIIVDKDYCIIDGYHRFKNSVIKDKDNIEVVVLDDYRIKRFDDSLLSFIKLLSGKTITFISDEIICVGKKYYVIEPNEGCGGCSNGWSSIEVTDKYKGKSIDVETVESKELDEDVYELIINGDIVAKVDTGYGNGYYGGDFEISILT